MKRKLVLLDANLIENNEQTVDALNDGELDPFETQLIRLVNKHNLDGYFRVNTLDADRGWEYHPFNNTSSRFTGGVEYSEVINRYRITCPEVYLKNPSEVLDIGPYGTRMKQLFRSSEADWATFVNELKRRASNSLEVKLSI